MSIDIQILIIYTWSLPSTDSYFKKNTLTIHKTVQYHKYYSSDDLISLLVKQYSLPPHSNMNPDTQGNRFTHTLHLTAG